MAGNDGKTSDGCLSLSSCLQTLYPKWSEALGYTDDGEILDEFVLLLSYFVDCGAPDLFVHPMSDIGQALVDCAKVNFGGQAGDIPLVLNTYHKFVACPKRERHVWCAQNCVDYATVKNLEQAYNDLKFSVQAHRKRTIHNDANNNWKCRRTLREKLHKISGILLEKFPENLYIHDGKPGLCYSNVKSQKWVQIAVNSPLSLCPRPPKYVILMPSSSKTPGTCVITCAEESVQSAAERSKDFKLQLIAAKSKVLTSVTICSCGTAFEDILTANNCRRLNLIACEVCKWCGCKEEEVYVTADTLTHSLVMFCPESMVEKALPVVRERASIIRAECEASICDVDYPGKNTNGLVACLSSGGFLVETDGQPSYERTCVLWVDSPEHRRKVSDEDLSEEYVKESLLKSVDRVVAVRKFRDFPESPMWGLVIMKDTMACSEAQKRFNKTGGKYRLEWINTEVKDIVMNFSIEKKLKNKIWVQFSSQRDFDVAKKFSWDEYWVMEAFFFDDRQAKFVFKRDRPDLYRLKHDICDLANVDVITVKHETISPCRWPENDLEYVKEELEAKCKKINYLHDHKIEFQPSKENDTHWLGTIRFESYHPFIPDKFHGDIGGVQLRNGMVFVSDGVREGMTVKIPRRAYLLLKKEIEKEETDFHGGMGVRVSDDEDELLVSVHFIWWNGGKMSSKLQDLHDMIRPVVICGVSKGITELVKTDQRPFQAIERWFQVSIDTADAAIASLLVYGRKDNRNQAAEYLKTQLADNSVQNGLRYDVIPVSGPSVPNGLLTNLLMKYGPTLDKLQIRSGCMNVHLDKHTRVLLCKGSPASVEALREELDVCCSELAGDAWKGLFTQSEECAACLNAIEDPRNPVHHLEICGHSYCSDCLVSQVTTQLSQKLLPISCVAEECETKLSLGDIVYACDKGHKCDVDKFVEVALQYHLARNRMICKPCPTPDCPVMFHTAVDDDKKFNCPRCNTDTCIGCLEKWHPGLSCEIKKEIDELDDEKLKSWIMEKPKTRKMCPSCKSGVEKMGGCDNVHCSSCSTSMCWKCLAFFKTSGECYDHIATKHRHDQPDMAVDQSDDELADYD